LDKIEKIELILRNRQVVRFDFFASAAIPAKQVAVFL